MLYIYILLKWFVMLTEIALPCTPPPASFAAWGLDGDVMSGGATFKTIAAHLDPCRPRAAWCSTMQHLNERFTRFFPYFIFFMVSRNWCRIGFLDSWHVSLIWLLLKIQIPRGLQIPLRGSTTLTHIHLVKLTTHHVHGNVECKVNRCHGCQHYLRRNKSNCKKVLVFIGFLVNLVYSYCADMRYNNIN